MTQRTHRNLLRTLILIFGFLASLPAFAQYTTATLTCRVTDPSGASIDDAAVTVRNLDTGLTRTSSAGTNGAFTFTALPVGKYEVTVEKAGFSKFVQTGITLVVDQPVNIPVTLRIGDVSQQVTVASDAELVNTESGTVGQLINAKNIVDLPLNGREAAITALFVRRDGE